MEPVHYHAFTKANLTRKDTEKSSLLHHAAASGNLANIDPKTLKTITAYEFLEANDKGETPLSLSLNNEKSVSQLKLLTHPSFSPRNPALVSALKNQEHGPALLALWNQNEIRKFSAITKAIAKLTPNAAKKFEHER